MRCSSPSIVGSRGGTSTFTVMPGLVRQGRIVSSARWLLPADRHHRSWSCGFSDLNARDIEQIIDQDIWRRLPSRIVWRIPATAVSGPGRPPQRIPGIPDRGERRACAVAHAGVNSDFTRSSRFQFGDVATHASGGPDDRTTVVNDWREALFTKMDLAPFRRTKTQSRTAFSPRTWPGRSRRRTIGRFPGRKRRRAPEIGRINRQPVFAELAPVKPVKRPAHRR